MLPSVLMYISLFGFSMDTALDRGDYLRIMDVDYASNRIEPLLPLISNILGYLISNNVAKLVLIQSIFILIFLQLLYIYFKPVFIEGFFKILVSLLLFIAIFSNPLGVQLRIGYASFIFLFLIIKIKNLKYLKHFVFFIAPILMHYGTIFGVLFYWHIHIFKINSYKRFIAHSLIIIAALSITVLYIDRVFSILGLSTYYYSYLDQEREFGRSVPFSVLFYIAACLYNIFFTKERSYLFWFSLSGLWLVYLGLVLDFYLAFKMLLPISMYAVLHMVKSFPIERKPYLYILLAYILMPLVFYYFAIQVDLL